MSNSGIEQVQVAPDFDGPEAARVAVAATSASMHLSTSTAAPAERLQAPLSGSLPQQASVAAAVSQSREAEAMPASDKCCLLYPSELEVAAALLVVLQRALKEGQDALTATKAALASNDPGTSLFLQLLPEYGEPPSLKQLKGSASDALKSWLRSVSGQCAAAECQPLELFTRSALCRTHHRAMHSISEEDTAVREQQLQAIEASLGPSNADFSERDVRSELQEKVEVLAEHDVAAKSRMLLTIVLHETILLLHANKAKPGASQPTASSRTSWTACIDHMLPGEGCTAIHANPPDVLPLHLKHVRELIPMTTCEQNNLQVFWKGCLSMATWI